MAISDEKLKIVINNYFKSECDVNTSIREAFEKGFRIGVKKGLMQIGADRKTENCSEFPNNSTCSKMEQVDKDINVRSKEPQTIRCPKCGRTDYIRDMKKDMGVKDSCYKYKCINCNTYIKDEPQTCSVNGRPYDCGNCEYHKCTADEPQIIACPINERAEYWFYEDEPQTDYGDYERAVEQMQHDMRYEPTYNAEDGSM